MEKIHLINPGLDSWTVTLKANGQEFDLMLPTGTARECYAEQVKVGLIFQDVPTSQQWVREGIPLSVITPVESPFLAAYLILGALSALQLFKFIDPFKASRV